MLSVESCNSTNLLGLCRTRAQDSAFDKDSENHIWGTWVGAMGVV